MGLAPEHVFEHRRRHDRSLRGQSGLHRLHIPERVRLVRIRRTLRDRNVVRTFGGELRHLGLCPELVWDGWRRDDERLLSELHVRRMQLTPELRLVRGHAELRAGERQRAFRGVVFLVGLHAVELWRRRGARPVQHELHV